MPPKSFEAWLEGKSWLQFVLVFLLLGAALEGGLGLYIDSYR